MPTRSATTVDPRSPFVLDTRELGRRPGSMRRVQRTVPAPAEWALELVRVPEGADVELDLRLEAVMEGVLVSGSVRAPLAAECGRCLEAVDAVLDAEIQELFAYDPADAGDEVSVLSGDLLDLRPLLRDAVVLAMPINPVCDDACAGLCAICGARLADLPDDHAHEDVDPRWSKLSALRSSDAPSSDPASPEIGR
ncbi:MAG TPA: YceD family protein [Mycobacteriales bacterium]|nr:YceD family protein [Mycobacteriales bacterium]